MARVYQPRQHEAVNIDGQKNENLPTKDTTSYGQVEALKDQLAEAEKRASIAEALAEERGRHIEDLRRMLPTPEASQSRRRWWPW